LRVSTDKSPREKVLIEPTPKDPELFEWLEKLFDGETEYPERVEARVVSGAKFERMGPHVFQEHFDPTAVGSDDDERKKEPKTVRRRRGKPSREDLVSMSNQILHRCQTDCNSQRRTCVYAVFPWHFARGDAPYDRKLIRCDPKGVHGQAGEDVAGEDDEYGTHRNRWENQKLAQDARMFELHIEGLSSLIDRQDRALEREAQNAERLRQTNERLLEVNHRLVTQEDERIQKGKWTDLKIRSAEKVLDLGMDLAPPLLGRLTGGKKSANIEETPESLTLKRFLKLDTAGGKLTSAQAEAAFGVFDPESKKCTRPGVLNEDQLQLILDIAHLHAPADELTKLIPGGKFAITQDQLVALQQIFPMEQLASLITMIGVLMQQQAAQSPHQENA
jgi:hypothetical protein